MEIRDLVFSDGPMFQRLMSNADICRGVVERVLGTKVVEVENIVTEQVIEPRLGSHGIRLDAVLAADGRTYDVDMQSYRKGRLAKRLRYYQASLDIATLGPGRAYDTLPDTYIIFICTDDFLGTGLPVSTLDIRCDERSDFRCDHGFTWVILNASEWAQMPKGLLRDFLKFVGTGRAAEGDPLLSLIEREMHHANADAAWKEELMPFLTIEDDARIQARISYEDGMAEGLAEGKRKGIEEGQETLAALIRQLLAEGRIEDIEQATADPAARARLCEEFDLSAQTVRSA